MKATLDVVSKIRNSKFGMPVIFDRPEEDLWLSKDQHSQTNQSVYPYLNF